jgi:hypothetical protein
MKTKLVFIIMLLPLICWAQTVSEKNPVRSGSNCGECSSHPREDGAAICLSGAQMRSHVGHIIPLAVRETHVRAAGKLALEVRFDKDGKVSWVKAVSGGNPLIIASAMETVPKWTFKPVERHGKKYGGCGRLTVKFDLSDEKQETSVE